MWRRGTPALVAGVALAGLVARGPGAEPTAPDKLSLTALSQEVTALQTVRALDLTRAQMRSLRELARDTGELPYARPATKGSDELRKRLLELREALARGESDERIDTLSEKYEKLRDGEEADLQDDVEVTDEARAKAPAALRLLTARQVARYLAGFAEDIADPRERLLEALGKVRGLPAKEWEEQRESVADDVGRLVGGLDPAQVSRTSDRVVQLLIVARSLKENEYKAERAELEKKAQAIVGDLGPTDVLRRVMEHAVAELLSNPRLVPALDARLK